MKTLLQKLEAVKVTDDQLVRLKDVPGLGIIPPRRGGAMINPSTLYRWIANGSGEGKHKIRLQGTRVGGTWATRPDWIREFFAKLTARELQMRDIPDAVKKRNIEDKLRREGALAKD